jgi:MFS family permease
MMPLDGQNKTTRSVILFISLFLAIEGLDEIVDGVMGVAYPLIRHDLNLSYLQIGLLLTIPNTISSVIEPIFGVLGDFGHRRLLILGGGISFAIALLLISLSHHFWSLLAALVLFYPASGAFVSLSQAHADGFRTHPPRTKHGTLGIGGFSRQCHWPFGVGRCDRPAPELAECFFHPGSPDALSG